MGEDSVGINEDRNTIDRRSKEWTNRVSADLAEIRRILRKRQRKFSEDEIREIAQANSLILTTATLGKLKAWFGEKRQENVVRIRHKSRVHSGHFLSNANLTLFKALSFSTDSQADDVARLMLSICAMALVKEHYDSKMAKQLDAAETKRAALREHAHRLAISLLVKTDLSHIGAEFRAIRASDSAVRIPKISDPS